MHAIDGQALRDVNISHLFHHADTDCTLYIHHHMRLSYKLPYIKINQPRKVQMCAIQCFADGLAALKTCRRQEKPDIVPNIDVRGQGVIQ